MSLSPPFLLLLVFTAAAAGLTSRPQETRDPATATCSPASPLVRVDSLPEGSGVAAGRRSPGVLWAHNDSGSPVLIALNTDGAAIGSVRIEGAEVNDWEDIAAGPCPQGTCLYIADIGDNKGSRERITIYRVPEPSPKDAAARGTEAFHASYPDGAHDAEAFFVTPEAAMYIITKGDPGPVALYRFPGTPKSGMQAGLERVGTPLAERAEAKDRPTAADASSDGRWVAIRTVRWLEFHRAPDLTAGTWRAIFRVDLGRLREPRGEGLALGRDGSVFLVGEAAGGPGGTFARLSCALPPS